MNIPYPIIFGLERPQLRMRIEYGKQILYSLTNYNLCITEDWLHEGTLEISHLYRSYWKLPNFINSQGLGLTRCDTGKEPCRMFVEKYEEMPLERGDATDNPTKLIKLHLHTKPQLYECGLLSALLNCLNTPAERKFAELYYTWALSDWSFKSQDFVPLTHSLLFGDFAKLWQEKRLHDKSLTQPSSFTYFIKLSLRAPALIPQVWLNYTYDPNQSPQKETDDLEYMPKRVDFLLIKDNKVYVIEIDDPSHYATYNKSNRKYEVSEERYTNNLRAERILRKQGFEIRRLSNWEILNGSDSEIIKLFSRALDLPIYAYRPKPELLDYGDIPF